MDAKVIERLRKTAEFVKARRATTESTGYANPDFDYRWKHTLRVVQYGKQLAEAEGADIEVCMSACLLHDISKFDAEEYGVEHGRVSARIARPFLETLGYDEKRLNNICYCIAVHVDDKSDFEHPVTLESKIVSDADNIDRFGAYRLLIQFSETGNYETLVEKAATRLLALKKYRAGGIMGTSKGEELFNRQLDVQIHVLERLVEDSRITVEI